MDIIRFTIIFCLFFASVTGFAFEIDNQKYFAYYKIPDKHQGGVSIFSPVILLSHEVCEAKGIHKSIDAKKGLSFWPGTDRTRYECWTELKEEIILVCPVGTEETSEIGNACIEISKSRFIDTYSLPQSANYK